MAPSPTIIVITADGRIFRLSEAAAQLSTVINNTLSTSTPSSRKKPIPLPTTVTAAALPKIIEYLEKHASSTVPEDEMQKFDADYLAGEPFPVLYDVAVAARDLEIDVLLDEVCKKMSDALSGTSLNWIQKSLDVITEFLPPEDRNRLKALYPDAFGGDDK